MSYVFTRQIDEIIIHCTATLPGQPVDVPTLARWHKAQGMSDVGYHFVIGVNGEIMAGRPITQEGAHCFGHNMHSIGIAYIGGLNADGKPEDTRTSAQKLALIQLIQFFRLLIPDIAVHGHNEFSNKACPCFNVQREYYLLFH